MLLSTGTAHSRLFAVWLNYKLLQYLPVTDWESARVILRCDHAYQSPNGSKYLVLTEKFAKPAATQLGDRITPAFYPNREDKGNVISLIYCSGFYLNVSTCSASYLRRSDNYRRNRPDGTAPL